VAAAAFDESLKPPSRHARGASNGAHYDVHMCQCGKCANQRPSVLVASHACKLNIHKRKINALQSVLLMCLAVRCQSAFSWMLTLRHSGGWALSLAPHVWPWRGKSGDSGPLRVCPAGACAVTMGRDVRAHRCAQSTHSHRDKRRPTHNQSFSFRCAPQPRQSKTVTRSFLPFPLASASASKKCI
jgi:hypothetical protein